MKTKKLLFLAMTLFVGLFVSQAYADVTKTVNGAGGADYLTLKAAFDAINAGTISTGVITLQITGSTIEADSITLNANGAVSGAVYSSVNIYPTVTGLSISGNLSSSLIMLNGADQVTIDGRVNDGVNPVVNTRDLTITNTGGSDLTKASTIVLTSNAQYNTIKYCTIKGSGTGGAAGSGKGTIAFTTSSVTTGNGNNIISNNLITNANNAKRPTNSIYSLGSTGFPNTNNTITDNVFADFASPSAATNAIYLSALNSAWTISGNSFYESTTYAPTAGFAIIAINVLGGSGYTVNNNFIGGSAVQCGGTTAWTKTSATANAFMGISLTLTAGGTASEVQGNTIKNFAWNNSAAAYWTGINIAAGNANIGTTAGNMIGASTGTGSITFNYTGTGSLAAVNGIAIPGTGTVNMQNNTIGSITTTNATATLSASINGVNITGAAGTVTFSNNTINNLYANSTSTTAAQTIFGINNSPNNTVTIDHNTITNLINATTNATVTVASTVSGIKSANGALTVTNNTIHDLTIACANTKAPSSVANALCGIMLYGANGVRTVSGNTIYNLYDSYPSFAGFINGISFFGTAPGNHVVDHNFIYNLGVTGTTTDAAATVYGIIGGTSTDPTTINTFSNNVITLGGNTATTLQGINEGATNAVGTNNFYFNTVYIGGSPTSGTNKSYCLYSVIYTNTRNFRNNIFVNARSNGGTATGKHYAAYFNYLVTDLLTLGYNDYFVSGTGGVLGYYNAADVTALPLITGLDASSLAIDPVFSNAGGTTAVSYYTSATLPAVTGTGITTDYLGFTRPVTPKMGALENADKTKTVGGTGADYATLKAAFNDINNGIIGTGVITLQITGNTIETVSDTLNANGVGSAAYSSVNIYPTVTGLSISGDLSSSLIMLNGADYVTIDGRLHATDGSLAGTTRDLTITNTGGATLTTASTITLASNAQNNTIKYCTIKGSGTGVATSGKGTIAFTTADAVTGNGNNTISNNLITNADNAKRPTHSINSLGSTGFPNTNNTIKDNEFADFTCLSAATNAIYLSALNSAWTISGNSFYESAAYTPAAVFAIIAINVLGGTDYTITNNYIGGSAAQCGGNAWTKNAGTAANNQFTGIALTLTAGEPASNVQGNTIKNFNWSNSTAAIWTGINIAAGNVNVGTTTGNTIGANDGTTGSITYKAGVTAGYLNGFSIQSPGTINMLKNTIGSITADNAASTPGATSIYAVNISAAVTGTVTFNNNTINNINASSPSTGAAQVVNGIVYNANGNITISGNTIANLNNATTNPTAATVGTLAAIKVVNGTYAITNNIIHDLTIASANTGAPVNNSLTGIMLYGSTTPLTGNTNVRTVTGNTIYNLYNTYSSFAGYICGIIFYGFTNGNVIDHNFIYNLGVTGTVGGNTLATTAKVYGIRASGYAGATTTYSNNIITLGGNTATTINGINESGAATVNNNFYFNTIYIGGSLASGVANQSFCLNSAAATNARDFRNNIFVNTRSTTDGIANLHYAVCFAVTGGTLTLDNNDYYVNGTGGVLGNYGGGTTATPSYNLLTLADWQNASGTPPGPGQDVNSLAVDPLFSTAGGTTAVNYYTSATLPAVTGTGITTDYLGFTRPNTPKMGALENTIILSASATTLTGLDYNLHYGTGPSAEQSFTVSGSSLANNVTVTPPADYEISLTSGSGYQATALTLTPVSGTLASTTIYVRLKAGLTVATYTEDISITSSGATLQTVTLNGIVTDIATALSDVSTNLKVSTVNGYLKVTGVKAGDLIEVYNGLGQKIKMINATDVDNNIDVNAKGVLVVKVGSKATKVIL